MGIGGNFGTLVCLGVTAFGGIYRVPANDILVCPRSLARFRVRSKSYAQNVSAEVIGAEKRRCLTAATPKCFAKVTVVSNNGKLLPLEVARPYLRGPHIADIYSEESNFYADWYACSYRVA